MQKKAKTTPQVNVVGPALPTIQEEVADVELVKVLKKKRTRGGCSDVVTSQLNPKIQKKRRCIRKMKVFDYVVQEEAEVEDFTALVTRMERNKKAAA